MLDFVYNPRVNNTTHIFTSQEPQFPKSYIVNFDIIIPMIEL